MHARPFEKCVTTEYKLQKATRPAGRGYSCFGLAACNQFDRPHLGQDAGQGINGQPLGPLWNAQHLVSRAWHLLPGVWRLLSRVLDVLVQGLPLLLLTIRAWPLLHRVLVLPHRLHRVCTLPWLRRLQLL